MRKAFHRQFIVLVLVMSMLFVPMPVCAADDVTESSPFLLQSGISTTSLYNKLLSGLKNLDETIDISKYNIALKNSQYLCDVFGDVLRMNIDLHYVSFDFKYNYDDKNIITEVLPDYTVKNTEKINTITQQLDSKINGILGCLDSSMSDAEKLLVIYNEVTLMGSYDTSLKNKSAKNLLLDQSAICQGYASAMYAIAKEAGIKGGFVRSENMDHIWNRFYIDGVWYHVDATWDDSPGKNPAQISYGCFLKSDKWMTENEGHYDFVPLNNDNAAKYDNYFWNNTQYPVVLVENKAYYISGEHAKGSLLEYDLETNKVTKIYNFNNEWPASADGQYQWDATFSGLAYFNNRLYFNTEKKIMSCKLDGTNIKTEYVLPTSSEDSIYGCYELDDKLHYVVGKRETPTQVHFASFLDLVEINPLPIRVEGVIVDASSCIITEGEKQIITASIFPQNASNKRVFWKSSNEDVATVKNGTITALKRGSATITAITEDENHTAFVNVVVKQSYITGDINADGVVNDEDAFALFKAISFPEIYSINYKGSVDFSGDGVVNVADATILFCYANFLQFFQIS